MTILGLDYGSKKIGLAKSVGTMAVPLFVLPAEPLDSIVERLVQICKHEGVDQVVVGLPTGLSGAATAQTQTTQEFVDQLRTALPVPVVTADERFSTQEALKLMAGQAKGTPDDAVAAMVMLQSFLDQEGQALSSKS